MSFTIWFLLEFTVILALAAGVFACLGWKWRGYHQVDRMKKQTAEIQVESLKKQRRALQKTLQQISVLADVPCDDLTQIQGITGILSKQLHALGIHTWRQIAEWNDDDVLAFSEFLDLKNSIYSDRWQEQAKRLLQT
ncbi:MAG: hypothetical protein ACKO8Z_18785 [Prosthecobacter sp.]